MTIRFPDVSHYNGAVNLTGAPAVIAKATQGTGYVDAYYARNRDVARAMGVPFVAYHWLDTSDAAAQARHCFSVVGPNRPLMIDDEQNTINVGHTLAFVAAYRALGGVVKLEYAPQWVWSASGKPDLSPLARAGLFLVSSSYPRAGYTDNGPGWASYGGMTPAIWQYSSTAMFNGQPMDMNAYRGTVAELVALLGGPPVVEAPIHLEDDMKPIWYVRLGGASGRIVRYDGSAYFTVGASVTDRAWLNDVYATGGRVGETKPLACDGPWRMEIRNRDLNMSREPYLTLLEAESLPGLDVDHVGINGGGHHSHDVPGTTTSPSP